MKQIQADGGSGVTDMGTLLNQQADAQRAGDDAYRIKQLVTPNAQQVWIKNVYNDRDGTIRISDFRAEFADGTVVRVPSIVIEPG
jgi:hypothetical protein